MAISNTMSAPKC